MTKEQRKQLMEMIEAYSVSLDRTEDENVLRREIEARAERELAFKPAAFAKAAKAIWADKTEKTRHEIDAVIEVLDAAIWEKTRDALTDKNGQRVTTVTIEDRSDS